MVSKGCGGKPTRGRLRFAEEHVGAVLAGSRSPRHPQCTNTTIR